MCKPVFPLFCTFFLSCAVICSGQQALRSTVNGPTAGVRGRITMDEVVGRAAQSSPIPKLKLYLLRVEDSRPLVELQERCRRATADPNANPLRAYQTCDQGLRQAVQPGSNPARGGDRRNRSQRTIRVSHRSCRRPLPCGGRQSRARRGTAGDGRRHQPIEGGRSRHAESFRQRSLDEADGALVPRYVAPAPNVRRYQHGTCVPARPGKIRRMQMSEGKNQTDAFSVRAGRSWFAACSYALTV